VVVDDDDEIVVVIELLCESEWRLFSDGANVLWFV